MVGWVSPEKVRFDAGGVMLGVGDEAGSAANVEVSGALDELRPISCPLVLQCVTCRTIVGDTCTIIDLNPNLRTITLQRTLCPCYSWLGKAEGAIIDETLHTSLSGMDYGRGQFTFSSDALAFYELSGEIPTMSTAKDNIAITGNTTTPEPRQINVSGLEITKLQKFCLYLYDRVAQLEEQLKAIPRSSKQPRVPKVSIKEGNVPHDQEQTHKMDVQPEAAPQNHDLYRSTFPPPEPRDTSTIPTAPPIPGLNQLIKRGRGRPRKFPLVPQSSFTPN
ncbi:hypothetical protein PSACC_01237 [Paramicrosporidium saccamoebae]|uniref:Mis18 domain-containing protein n=1 Tax=Paramicrosporidium saccamoebae TaxID=1246581 RepID=A0A2H9TMT0_9FUNG|nr:hypothetical protein PSACC_01237 [Paramicrosporidium saccamoebae]